MAQGLCEISYHSMHMQKGQQKNRANQEIFVRENQILNRPQRLWCQRRYCDQLIKRPFDEKSGSDVRFTPNFLNPALSAVVGM